MKKNKKAFTLIELIAVLVILAIIALIVTPLVMNIVKKAKDSANKRSVDAYGKAVELGVSTYLLDTGYYPTNLDSITIEYSGNEVVCSTKELNKDGSIYLSGCSVNGVEVKDASTEDGYYHYGKTTSTAPKTYNVGDVVTYNGMNFYVIAPSDANSDSVTLLKEEPLTVDEVNTYGAGHINMYVRTGGTDYRTAYNNNGYGGMQYYTSSTCGVVNGSNINNGCTTDYEMSDVKYVVDAWANDKLNGSDLKEDITGYSARLITYEELTNNLGYVREGGSEWISKTENVPSWVYNGNYDYYWTMSVVDNSNVNVWYVSDWTMSSVCVNNYVGSSAENYNGTVRPVINLLKSAISE